MNEEFHVSRQVIEKKLLTALEDKGCVAILASEEDLRMMIDCLRTGTFHSKGLQMADDLEQLLHAAFP